MIFITPKIIKEVLFLSEERLFEDKFSLDMEISDIIDDIRRNIFSSSSVNGDAPIYVAASFLTDQFHVLRKHWKKNVNKDDKSTGTGKGIDGLQANQKGFEPELGGKFIIIDWCNKEIVYTLDIEENYLYVANIYLKQWNSTGIQVYPFEYQKSH